MNKRLKRLWAKRSSSAWIEYLRNVGVRIGEGTMFYCRPWELLIDTTRPYLIEIGKNVQITKGVTVLTHGFDWSVLKAKYGDIIGSAGKVKIGDNCFIGMNTLILKNTTIGDNVIVGAGSVLTGREYPSNTVVAGNPARVICTLEEYYNKRLGQQKKEAKELVLEYYKTYKAKPDKGVLSEFFWLFEKREDIKYPPFVYQMKNMNNYDMSLDRFMKTKPEFDGYDDFLNYCFNNTENLQS